MRYIYKVTSDVPLSVFQGSGGTVQVSPAGRRPIDQVGVIEHAASGPAGTLCHLRVELMAVTPNEA